ncbi:spermidine/putrescine ABC transporter substrate-binding protein [Rhizobium rhizosphaerae]|uniref:Spermidine/putrescine ABC transporter substrate-binding protein n=1 Tax=Xaviernesmea rhizosphaerae TaxID=1672749 RepID=A0A1Q9AH10_9HYPH|nr:spermidine/putrescine ABC transporter substrate-binding protein [Xaviernesmea rhizosphaerae]OLP54498.1 spermidine/putrescine ABC transporter substrate-binding protein [Xaviernesmea rhizosphaerae]OQP85922.1 spermidine/putrescine ABC transporter substrate-binding protein [Xaviernesmea rhizosphaerae]
MRPLLLAASLTVGLAAPGQAQAETLNLLIWESYIDQSLLDSWSARTGISVKQSYYDSGDMRDEMLADPESKADLVVIGEGGGAIFGKRGLLEPLSVETIPALESYEPSWRQRCGGYGVPYLWGTMGILYRSDQVTSAPTSWEDLLLPSSGMRKHIAMYNDHSEAFVPALVYLGQSINTNDKPVLKAAFELMKRQAPFVLTYDYVISSVQDPKLGDRIYMALGYSGDQKTLNDKTGQKNFWRYAVPKEGTLSWLDCIAVMAHSPRKALALDLVEFLSQPRQAAQNAVALRMPVVSQAALAFVPPAQRGDPEIYPPDEALARIQFQTELSAQSIQLRRRIITAVASFQ